MWLNTNYILLYVTMTTNNNPRNHNNQCPWHTNYLLFYVAMITNNNPRNHKKIPWHTNYLSD